MAAKAAEPAFASGLTATDSTERQQQRLGSNDTNHRILQDFLGTKPFHQLNHSVSGCRGILIRSLLGKTM